VETPAEPLTFATEPRARTLLADLDARLLGFLGSLPETLASRALRRSTFVGGPPEARLTSLATLNPLIACSPWLFWEAFGSLPDGVFVEAAVAGAALSLSSGIMDKLADGEAPQPGVFSLLSEALRLHAWAGFRTLFPAADSFWAEFQRLSETYWKALAEESELQRHPAGFTEDAFTRVSAGKVSPIVVTLAAMAHLSEHPDLLPPMEQSLRWTFVAGQLHDDILDWETDVASGHVTHFIRQLNGDDGRSPEGITQRARQARARSWADVDMFKQVLHYYGLARDAVRVLDCPTWGLYLTWHEQRARRDQISAAAAHLERILSD
jgi:hypothetical protein